MAFLVGILTRLGLSYRIASGLAWLLLAGSIMLGLWYFESSIESHYRNKFSVEISDQLREEYKDLLIQERESAKERERALLSAQNRYTRAIESLKTHRAEREKDSCGQQVAPLAGSVLRSLRQ